MNESIERILSKLASKKLGPVLSINEINSFETVHKISLPEDYKEFLMNVGNGGDGPPEYGLLKLGEINKNDTPHYFNEGYQERLSKPFPFIDYWVWDGEEDNPGFESELLKTEYGCLVLGHDGCGLFWLLIVNGSEKGKIWQTSDMGIQPCAPSLTFTEWYENWLNGNTDWWAGYESEVDIS